MTPALVLASSSPRRRDLLARIGVTPARIEAPAIDESPRPRELPRVYALRLAEEKAGAVARVDGSELAELVITDSIQPTPEVGTSTRIRTLTIAPLLGEAIKRIADESSVSSLID